MKKIIAPVDFSEVSKNAALYAANMAAYLNLPLVLIHVSELPVTYAEVPVIPVNDMNVADDKERLHNLVKEIEAALMGQVSVETVSRTGNPVYEIASYCNRIKTYTVVIGTHGNGSFTRFLLGSTTLGVIKECVCPVTVVPQGFSFTKPGTIGLASDMHEVARQTPAAQIAGIVEDFGSKLEILHVDKTAYDDEEPELVEGTRELQHLFELQHPKVRILKSVFTEETLLNYAAEKHLDLLIVVPKKHSWIDTLLKHQHTKHLALHAPVPVMVIKPQ